MALKDPTQHAGRATAAAIQQGDAREGEAFAVLNAEVVHLQRHSALRNATRGVGGGRRCPRAVRACAARAACAVRAPTSPLTTLGPPRTRAPSVTPATGEAARDACVRAGATTRARTVGKARGQASRSSRAEREREHRVRDELSQKRMR